MGRAVGQCCDGLEDSCGEEVSDAEIFARWWCSQDASCQAVHSCDLVA